MTANACPRRGAVVPFASLRRSRSESDTFQNPGTGDYPSPRYLRRAAGHAVPRVRTVHRSADPLRRGSPARNPDGTDNVAVYEKRNTALNGNRVMQAQHP